MATSAISDSDRSIIINALGDHVRALESNRRRAARGQSVAIAQGDEDTAAAYERTQAAADARIKRVRAVQARISR